MSEQEAVREFPDGIGDRSLGAPTAFEKHKGWLSLLLLGAIMITAMSGVLGGWGNSVKTVKADGAGLAVDAPDILRSGEFFEMRIVATARAPIEKPVLATSSAYWRGLTINTLVPTPAEEEFRAGAFEFSFGPLHAGERLEIKVDGQVNPARRGESTGRFALRDGEEELVAMPLQLQVLP